MTAIGVHSELWITPKHKRLSCFIAPQASQLKCFDSFIMSRLSLVLNECMIAKALIDVAVIASRHLVSSAQSCRISMLPMPTLICRLPSPLASDCLLTTKWRSLSPGRWSCSEPHADVSLHRFIGRVAHRHLHAAHPDVDAAVARAVSRDELQVAAAELELEVLAALVIPLRS